MSLMDTEHLLEDLRDYADKIKAWDREDVYKMYEWMIQIKFIARVLNDDALVKSIIQPDKLPVGTSPTPKNRAYVWTWDNHGRYLVGENWTEDKLKIRRLDELEVK